MTTKRMSAESIQPGDTITYNRRRYTAARVDKRVTLTSTTVRVATEAGPVLWLEGSETVGLVSVRLGEDQ